MERCDDTKRVLAYCKNALAEIRAEELTGVQWERHWASLMALLRTACLVLQKEAPAYWTKYMKEPNAEVEGRDKQKDWRPEIFGKFIWTDANLFLHAGRLTVGQSRMVFIQGVSARALVGGERIEPLSISPPRRPPQTSYHMNDGYYVGQDPRDLADHAIEWLERQIVVAET